MPRQTSKPRRRAASAPLADRFGRPVLRAGDAVIHLDHGMGKLVGLEEGPDPDGPELVVIEYADGTRLLVSTDEMDRVWRYGSNADAVTLDKMGSGAWAKRSADAAKDVAEAAIVLAEAARKRRETPAPVIAPEAGEMERFASGFPYDLTRDQAAAVEAALADMGRGTPMDRLVCGDVGFGKTEVALRTAAAAALCGYQVAVVAPTTVLARQHALTFARRFERIGLQVAHLSRLASGKAAKEAKERLATGEVRVVVGTHALLSRTVRFAKLGLLIVDEEQRFGLRHKEALRTLGTGLHMLTMTATPIPRTLQSAMIGLREISVLRQPPVARKPVETRISVWSDGEVREVLVREKARDGQSFVVCPRLSDLEAVGHRLKRLAPDLRLRTAHGKLKAEELDEVMAGFADGDGDVLLATNIIESGLDVPRANTLVVWRADLFGLSQLHQLRGRVGRSDREALALLTTRSEETDEDAPSEEARQRLAALERLQGLGAGFDIGALDLDQRGAGSLVDEAQAGHVTVLGADLYAHLLRLALRGADVTGDDVLWTPELKLGLKARLPADYIPNPQERLRRYAEIDRAFDTDDLDDIIRNIEARHGPLPRPARVLVEHTRLQILCHELGVAGISAGPKGVALALRDDAPLRAAERAASEEENRDLKEGRLVEQAPLDGEADRLEAAKTLLSAFRDAAKGRAARRLTPAGAALAGGA